MVTNESGFTFVYGARSTWMDGAGFISARRRLQKITYLHGIPRLTSCEMIASCRSNSQSQGGGVLNAGHRRGPVYARLVSMALPATNFSKHSTCCHARPLVTPCCSSIQLHQIGGNLINRMQAKSNDGILPDQRLEDHRASINTTA
jgi:hypothetical protein